MSAWLQSQSSVFSALAAVGWFLLGAAGMGAAVLRRREPRLSWEWALVALTVGMIVVGWGGMVLGLLHAFGRVSTLWYLAAVAAAAIPSLWITGLSAFRQGVYPRAAPLVVAGLGLLIVITLGAALCPPVSWDALVYHIAVPSRWHGDGYPAVYSDLPYSGFPLLAELWFWLLLPLDGLIAPQLLMYVVWLLALSGLYLLLRERLAQSYALLLALAFASSATVLMSATDTYVDQMVVLVLTLMLLQLRRVLPVAPSTSELGRALLLGLLAGGAAAVKLTGAVLVLLPLVWYGLHWRRLPRPRLGVIVAVYLAVAAATALPFYLRPWLLTGNPLHPYFAAWFTAAPAELAMSAYHHAIGSARFGLHSVAGFFSAPLLLALRPQLFEGGFGWQGLVVLALALLAVVCAARRSEWLCLFPAWIGAALYVFWFATAQQSRFLVPAALVATVLAGEGLARLPPGVRRLAGGVLAALTLFSLPLGNSGYYVHAWRTVFGRLAAVDFINTGTYGKYLPAMDAVGVLTPPEARVLLLFEHRTLYLPRQGVIGTPFFQAGRFTPPELAATPEAILSVLRQQGITHVLLATEPEGPDLLPEYLSRCVPFAQALGALTGSGRLAILWQSDRYRLCRVQ